MPNKLQRARQPKLESTNGDVVPGKLIRHEQTDEVSAIEQSAAWKEDKDTISHLHGRITLLLMGYRDLKQWLREIESYLNFDARYGAMEFFKQKFVDLENKISTLDKDIKEVSKRLDDALKEE